MKVAPVSADLLVKLAIGALVVGGGVYLVRRAWAGLPTLPDVGGLVSGAIDTVGDFASDTADAVTDTFWTAEYWARDVRDNVQAGFGQAADFTWRQATTTLNPASTQNAVYGGVNAIGSSVTGDSNWNLGGWLYDLLNPDPMAPLPPRGTDARAAVRRIDNALGY